MALRGGVAHQGLGGTFDGQVTIDPVKLARYLRSPHGPLLREILVIGNLIKRGAQADVGVKTGRLRDSIVVRVVEQHGDPAVAVGSEVPYAAVHHEGSEPHEIRGNPLLAFFWEDGPDGSKVYYFPKVQHPGTKPNKYLSDQIRKVRALY